MNKILANTPKESSSINLSAVSMSFERESCVNGEFGRKDQIQANVPQTHLTANEIYARLLAYQSSYLNYELPENPINPEIHQLSDNHESVSTEPNQTIFNVIDELGHDIDFDPTKNDLKDFCPTDAPAGSQEKIEVLKKRVELGQPLFHEHDRVDYAGLVAAIRPRD